MSVWRSGSCPDAGKMLFICYKTEIIKLPLTESDVDASANCQIAKNILAADRKIVWLVSENWSQYYL